MAPLSVHRARSGRTTSRGSAWAPDRSAEFAATLPPLFRLGFRVVGRRFLRELCKACGTCVETITNALQSTPGVKECEVDLATERAVVLCDRVVADSALVRAIERSDSLYTAHVTGL